MSDYAPAEPVTDWLPVDDALRDRLLPAPLTLRLPTVITPTHEPVAAPGPLPHDPWPARLVSAGVFVGLAGGGVWLAGQGVRAAGPYLWALAAALGALAGLVALLKSRGASGPGGATVHVERSRNVRINL